MYSILVKDPKNSASYKFLTVKKEIVEEKIKEETDPETNETAEKTIVVKTGEYVTERFETESRNELEEKCIEVLGKYNKNEFIPVNTEPFKMDLIWDSDDETTNSGESGLEDTMVIQGVL